MHLQRGEVKPSLAKKQNLRRLRKVLIRRLTAVFLAHFAALREIRALRVPLFESQAAEIENFASLAHFPRFS